VQELLREAPLEVVGRLVASSNSALVCRLAAGTVAVYKPIAFERPLWDFPDGTLAHREVAAYLVSEETGIGVVPPTVLREGPFGVGSVQLWVDPAEDVDPLELIERDDPRLRLIALFDAIVNNADRKVGHLLPQPDGRILGVDHGICFHAEPKLRTVLWAWRGQPLAPAELAILERVADALPGVTGRQLAALLTPEEAAATARRVDDLRRTAVFPLPDPDRPAIPWPPY
jgi:hypothetical protein